MKKILYSIIDGIIVFVYQLVMSACAYFSLVECLQSNGIYAVGNFFFFLLALGMFLVLTFQVGVEMKGGAE